MNTGGNKFFSVDLFRQDILVIDNRDGLDKFIDENGGIDSEMLHDAWRTSGAFAYNCEVDDKPYMAICIVKPVASFVCHESVHIAMTIMRNAGIPATSDTEELLAYLTEYIFAQTCIIAGIE